MQARRCGTASVADAPRVCALQTNGCGCLCSSRAYFLALRPKISSLETTGSCSRLFKRLSYNAHRAYVHPSLASKYSFKLEQETGTDAVLAKLLPRTYFFQFLTDFEKLPVFLFQCRTFAPDLNRNLYADHPFATGQDSVLEQETRRRLEKFISLTGLGEWTNRYGQSA